MQVRDVPTGLLGKLASKVLGPVPLNPWEARIVACALVEAERREAARIAAENLKHALELNETFNSVPPGQAARAG